ncbi:hypothetical protein C9224_21485 [Escherichia coli]|nr:hypothetical protein C9224_21485 [Escherichia coli]
MSTECSGFFHHRTGQATMWVQSASCLRGKTSVCIVSDYSRILAQKSLPVGLRSLLMREYGDNTTH